MATKKPANRTSRTPGPPTGSRRMPLTDGQLLSMAEDLGTLGARVIDPTTVETAAWVRLKCHYGCGGYGRSLMCPPHSPPVDQTRQVLDSYRRGVLLEAAPGDVKDIAVTLEREVFLAGHYKALAFGCGPCHLCGREGCALEVGCRHPDTARPSMESCGIDVYATVRKHGFTIDVVRDHDDEQHHFGLVLVD